jgi:hypothetical protein
VHVITCELLFEANDIRAVFASLLQLYFSRNLGFAFVGVVAVGDHFHGELLAAASVLSEHHLAECALAQLFNQLELV